MGLVNSKIILENPKEPNIEPIEVEALADSGLVHLCIPEYIRIQLQLEFIREAIHRRIRMQYMEPKVAIIFI